MGAYPSAEGLIGQVLYNVEKTAAAGSTVFGINSDPIDSRKYNQVIIIAFYDGHGGAFEVSLQDSATIDGSFQPIDDLEIPFTGTVTDPGVKWAILNTNAGTASDDWNRYLRARVTLGGGDAYDGGVILIGFGPKGGQDVKESVPTLTLP